MTDAILARASRRALVLDGAMATELHATDGPPAPAPACDGLSISQPSRVRGIHDAYLRAGADIVRTNTFRAAAREHERTAHALCAASARLAREAADEWSRRTPGHVRFVAGALGPGDEIASRARVRDAYRAPLRALLDGRVDLVLFETWYCPAQTAGALQAVADAAADANHMVPVVLSVTLDASGRLPVSGAAVDDVLAAIDPSTIAGLGVNCGAGFDGLEDALIALRRHAPLVTCHPSAGLPDPHGRYPHAPAGFADRVASLAVRGLADIVGGCCGTTPAHIEALARAVAAGTQ
jgi:5-methyltetrahydrofolate--homocysteine methyltransferase